MRLGPGSPPGCAQRRENGGFETPRETDFDNVGFFVHDRGTCWRRPLKVRRHDGAVGEKRLEQRRCNVSHEIKAF